MITKRIIPCLDVKDGRTTKGVKFQNNIDIGSFNAVVTMQSGNGGEIKGVILSAIIVEDEKNSSKYYH